MTMGLKIRNAAGDVVMDTSSTVLNLETVAVTSVTVNAGQSTNVSVPDVHVPAAVIVELDGTGAENITTSTSTDTLTLTNSTATDRTVSLEMWRLS